jgi:hypothetical protein
MIGFKRHRMANFQVFLVGAMLVLVTSPVSAQDGDVQHAPPLRVTSGLYQNNPACPTAKLDLWFDRGRYTHTLFMLEPVPEQHHDWSTDESGTVVLIGGDGCRIRIRIERAD